MPFDWTRFAEGEVAAHSEVNDAFSGIRAEVNDLPELSIQPRSLHHAHIPSIVGVSANVGTTDLFIQSNRYVDFLDTSQASSPTGTGWYRLGPSGSPLRVLHAPVDCGDTSAEPISYVAMANIQLGRIHLPGAAPNSSANSPFHYGVFQFQLQLSPDGVTTTWVHFQQTQRYVNAETEDNRGWARVNLPCQKDIPLRFLCPAALIRSYTLGGQQARYIHGARVVGALDTHGAYTAVQMELYRCNLSVFSLRAPKVA